MAISLSAGLGIWIAAIILVLAALKTFSMRGKVMGFNKNLVTFVFGLIGVFLIVGQLGYLQNLGYSPLAVGDGSNTVNVNQNNANACNYASTATYAVKDKFSSTAVSGGTSYYKTGSQPAVTTSVTAPNAGTSYQYWLSNGTYYVQPNSFTAACGTNNIIADAYANATATVTGFDTVQNQQTANGVYNSSMGANKQANIKITYQGTARSSLMPFGGVMVVEYNSTISSVTCTGDQVMSSNPYHVTYSPTSTANTYQVFGVSGALDDGSGSPRYVNCQFTNGATAAGAGSAYYAKFIPANYYITNAGDIVLDVEKSANADNTRTGLGAVTLTSYWGA